MNHTQHGRSRLHRLLLIVTLLVTLSCDFIASLRSEDATPAPEATAPLAPELPLPAPKLLFRTPQRHESQALDAPIELIFDQPMDTRSVTQAFEIIPNVSGEFAWVDTRTLQFTPDKPFSRGTHYQVTLDVRARSAEGTEVPEPISFDFTTVGFVEVSDVQPAPGSTDLDPDATVTVIFNRPIVPLAAVDRQTELPSALRHPLSFDPALEGQGEWLNTAVYRFRPTEGFRPATTYTARVAAGLQDTVGAILDQDYVWTFTSISPMALEWSPDVGAMFVGPGEPITVTFNQPMDHAATEAAFELRLFEQRVDGSFRWSGGQTPLAHETLIFTPAQPLPRNATGQVTIDKTARARGSAVTMQRSVDWTFWTVNDPGIIDVYPEHGSTHVEVSDDVEFLFAGPMQVEGFLDYLTITPRPTAVYTYWNESAGELRLAFPKEPATSYRLVLSPDTPDRYGARLAQGLDITFTTGDLSPYAHLSTAGNIGAFNAYTNTALYVRHRNVSRLDVALYRLPLDVFFKLYGYGSYDYRSEFRPFARDRLRTWTLQVETARNEAGLRRVDLTDDQGAQLPPGIYYVEVTAPEVQERHVSAGAESYTFVRTHTNLVMKQTQSESMVWATDLASGMPIGGLGVRFYRNGQEEEGRGITDRQGLWVAQDLRSVDLWDDYFAVVGQPGDTTFAIAYNDWDAGIRPWNFDLYSEFNPSPYIGYLYTDRPIYRPAQTLYFKGIARQEEDRTYRLPSGIAEVTVHVNDPTGKEIYSEQLPVSDMGSFDGSFKLDASAALGTYFIEARTEEWDFYTSASFRVAEYRKPDFQVKVNADRAAYLNGDTLQVAVEAAYYFGGPVANAAVTWNALGAPFTFEYRCPAQASCRQYSWSDYEMGMSALASDYGDGYGDSRQRFAQGATQTDARGAASFEVSAVLEAESQSRQFTLEATLTDINDQVVSQRTTAIVHAGAFYVGVSPASRVGEAGTPQPVDFLTVDWESQPVAGVMLDVVVMERRWYSVREIPDGADYAYWTWTTEDIPVYTTTVRTSAQGVAEITFVPEKSGSYRVRATGTDTHGNVIRSSAYLWVWGGDTTVWRRESTHRIDLVTDKDSYEIGDTAEILIASPYSGTVQALITVERGHIMETEIRTLTSNTELVRVPILESYVPNVFVSVILLQGSAHSPEGLASLKMGLAKLSVSTDSKQLRIVLAPDRDMAAGGSYRPRETALYDIQVTDDAGKPVEAELSLRLADLAVLALADEPGPTLLERFWSERGLGVRTSTPLVVAMEGHNRDLAPEAKGGGGADDTAGFIRSRFADTAFWAATVRTGDDGRARVEVVLPDNLTTWRMQARGITADTSVGQSDVDIQSTLDLLVRPVLPRFFVVGDEADIATIVHNNTAEAVEVAVTLTTSGLTVEGATVQHANLAAGGSAKVTWPVRVQPGATVTVRMEARAGSLYDGREDTLPVYVYTTPEIIATAGRISGPELRQEIVQLPPAFNPVQGELTVQVEGSLTAATQDALTYLEHYPYECVEQTVSRFLPNVLTYQALSEMGRPQPDLAASLRESVGTAAQKLYNEQHYDGGWGWWVSDMSNPYLTAYVLQGLLEAHRAGFTVDQAVMLRGAEYLRGNLPTITVKTEAWVKNRLAYQLYVLGEYIALIGDASAEGELGRAVALFAQRDTLDSYGKAMLAMAFGLLGQDSRDGSLSEAQTGRIKTLLSDLTGDAIMSATGTHWEETTPDYRNMNTDTRTTAVVLWALARHEPESPVLPNAVRWLMDMRREGAWESTSTTSWSLMALIAYMRATGEAQGDYGYTVALNGEVVMDDDISPEDPAGSPALRESRQAQVQIAQLLSDQANRLVIERKPATGAQTGEGQLYYTAQLRYFLPAAEVTALDRGFVIARQYSLVDDPDVKVNQARVGDVIRVKLTIVVPNDRHYVIIEDPLPAGCEAVDVTLNTTSVIGESPSVQRLTTEEEDRWYRWYGWGWWWFAHSEMRDEKVALFATYLPRGTYEYTYVMRAGVPGSYNVIPAMAYEMYYPEVFGRSDGGTFKVTDD